MMALQPEMPAAEGPARRLVIAQPPLDGAAPLSAGVLRFSTVSHGELRPHLGLVVKVAYSFAAEGGLSLIQAPPPCLDIESDLPGAAEGELSYASDFVPGKRAVDVLVTGHAYAELPAERIDAAITIGDRRREIVLVTSGATPQKPLSSAYLRGHDGVSPADPTGPVQVVEPWWEMPEGFDLSKHASATPSQRIPALPPGSHIELVGLSARARRRVLELPDVRPGAVLVGREEQGIPIVLSCDTLWIDTDAEILVLAYRGSVPIFPAVEAAARVGHVELWLDPVRQPMKASEVRRALQRGHFAYAHEYGDAIAGEAPPPIPADQGSARSYTLWGPSPQATIPLERYAQISAEMQEKREPRGDTLLRHELDEDRWALEERAWMEWMAAGAIRGDALPAKRFGDLFLAAQEALAAPAEAARGVDEYVPVKAAMEAGADPTKALAAFSMTLPEWMRLDRRFTQAMAKDGTLRAEIERKVASAEVDPRLLDDEAGLPAIDDEDEDEDEA
jgi:hypothetical protein